MGAITLAMGWSYWIAIQLVSLFLTLVGLPLIFVLARLGLWRKRQSLYYPARQILIWRGGPLTWLWGNEEDGVDGLRGGDAAQAWWLAETTLLSSWERIWLWSAWRNSVNNLRFLVKWPGGPLWQPIWGESLFRFGWNADGFPTLEKVR